MRGVHAHVGSQIMEPEPLAAAVAPLRALGEFEIYDLGGGLGARYTWADHPPSVADYLDVLIGGHRAPPAAGADHHRTGTQHGRVIGRDDLPGHHRQTRVGHLRGRRRRDGRQPRGRAVRPALRGRHRRPPRRLRRRAGHRRGPPLRERRRPRRRRSSSPRRASATCSPSRRPAPTASRWPTTTTAPGASRWSSRPTGRPGWWCVAKRGRTSSPATSNEGPANVNGGW